MGYSKSKRAIKKVQPYLEQMVAADGKIEFPVDDASDFAYSLREGIRASVHFALDNENNPQEPYASFSRLASKFIIRTKGSTVICEPRDIVPIVRLRESMGIMSIPDVVETLGIIGAAIQHKANQIVFPDASSATVDPIPLYNWAKDHEYYVIISDEHVTLTKNDPGELAWSP